jgi:uncharacterized protein (DUF1810 family)
MWFIFPQVDGPGSSPMARHYAIRSKNEAAAYLAHSALYPRLLECTKTALSIAGKLAQAIFGSPDDTSNFARR